MLTRDDLKIEKGKSYLAIIRARSDAPRSIRLVTSLPVPPWTGTGLFQSVELSSDWKETTCEFQAIETGPCRFYVTLAGPAATMDFTSIELIEKK